MNTILIVDDAEASYAALELALEEIGDVAITAAASAERALDRLTESAIAAVITDVQLPGLSGWDLVQTMRADPRWAALPIVVISASADPEAPAKARQSGANAYFTKPFSPLAVRRCLEQLLEESMHAR